MINIINIKNLKNKKGGGSTLILLFLSLLLMVFIVSSLDIYNFYSTNVKIKNSINRAVKSGALQLNTDIKENGENLAGKGIFLLNKEKAIEETKKTLAENLGLEEINYSATEFSPNQKSILTNNLEILEIEIIGDTIDEYNKMPFEYYSPTLKSNFLIKNPSVVLVVKFKVQSIFLKKEFVYGKLGSAQLINKEI